MDSMYGRSPGCKGKRWVCPNDRQLALRAKLRTGWSVKSESFESRFADFSYSSSCPGNLNSSPSSSTPYALTDEERTAIVQVIQRAEALDVSEQERVGRLVERLENMKRNVHTVTTARSSNRSCGSRCSGSIGCVCSCALCGEKFAVLGAGPSLCHDCRKYICQKCGIETSPSYVLTPGSSASSTGSGSTTPQHQPTVTLQLRLKSSSNNANKWFLCRICAETREMWKKSGAWFFKGLPKYVLPEKKERGRSRAGSRSLGWTTAGGTRSLEPPEQESSSDDEATRRMTRTRSLLSANCDVEVVHAEGATTPVGAPQLGVRSNSSTSVERRLSNENTVENAENSSNANNRRSSSTSSTATMRPKTGPSANGQRGRRSTIGDERKSELLTTDNTSVSQREQSEHQQQQQQEGIEHGGVGGVVDDERVEPSDEGSSSSRAKSGTGDRKSQQSRSPSKDRAQGVDGDGTGVRNAGDLATLRPGKAVSPVQSSARPRSPGHGHQRAVGSVLQAQHPPVNVELDEKVSKNEDCPQDTRSRIQRAAELLRNHGERYEERQSAARSHTSGRPSGTGLSRRSQISLIRSSALSNEILQRLPGGSLPGIAGREGVGRGHYQWQRSNSTESELQYSSSRFAGYSGACNQPPPYGQQRVF